MSAKKLYCKNCRAERDTPYCGMCGERLDVALHNVLDGEVSDTKTLDLCEHHINQLEVYSSFN